MRKFYIFLHISPHVNSHFYNSMCVLWKENKLFERSPGGPLPLFPCPPLPSHWVWVWPGLPDFSLLGPVLCTVLLPTVLSAGGMYRGQGRPVSFLMAVPPTSQSPCSSSLMSRRMKSLTFLGPQVWSRLLHQQWQLPDCIAYSHLASSSPPSSTSDDSALLTTHAPHVPSQPGSHSTTLL